jgi:hypothetical protein
LNISACDTMKKMSAAPIRGQSLPSTVKPNPPPAVSPATYRKM